MKITKVSIFSGIERTLDLDITQEQYDRWRNGEMIQNAMPNLSSDEREFLLTGSWDGEFDKAMTTPEMVHFNA